MRLRVDRGGQGAGHCSSLLMGCRGHDAGQSGPGEIGQVGGEFACGAWGARRAATSRRPSGPGRRRRGPTGAAAARIAARPAAAATDDRGRGLLADEVGQAADRVAGRGPVEGLLVDDEPVELRVGLDERQVGVDGGGDHLPRVGCCCLDRARSLRQQLRRRPGCRRRRRARRGRRSAGRRRSCWCRPRRRSPPCRRRRRACRRRPGSRRRVVRGARAGARPTASRAGRVGGRATFTGATRPLMSCDGASHRLGFHVTDSTAYCRYRPTPLDPEVPMAAPTRYRPRSSAGTGSRSPAPTPPYAQASNQDMLTATLDGLVARFGLQGEQLGEVVAGAVLKHSRDFNLTRESVLGSRLSATTPAYDVQQACGTGPRGRDPGRQQDRPRPDRVRHRRRRRHHVRRPARRQRRPAPRADQPEQRQDAAGPAQGAGADPPRPARAGDPAQRRAAHRPGDGRPRRDHRQGVGDRPRGAGRAHRPLAPEPGRRLRPRLLRRPGHARSSG